MQAGLFEAAMLTEKLHLGEMRRGLLDDIAARGPSMDDDVLVNKAATIKRCIARAREEYHADPANFATNYTHQDAAILNIQRACEAALDMGNHVIRRDRLSIAQHLDDSLRNSEALLRDQRPS